jgi:hypothetical protein
MTSFPEEVQEVNVYRADFPTSAAADACDNAADRAETKIFMLIAVEKSRVAVTAEIESSRHPPVIREQAVVPLPEALRRFSAQAAVLTEVKAVACRAAKGTGAAGKAASGKIVPERTVWKGLVGGGSSKNLPFDAAHLPGVRERLAF